MQGVIQHATINNLAFGRNIEETLRILQALQYVQENPDEVHHSSIGTLSASPLPVSHPREQHLCHWMPRARWYLRSVSHELWLLRQRRS